MKAAKASDGVAPRILIVEDDAIQALMLDLLVRQSGFSVLGPVGTAEQAVELCRKEWPDLALIDICLSGTMDGIELSTQLGRVKNLPIVFLSADEGEATLERIEQAKPLAFLTKPYKPLALRQVILHGLELAPTAGALAPSFEGETVVSPAAHYLFVREGGLLTRVDMAELTCVNMNLHYAVLVMNTGRRYSVRASLSELLGMLPNTDFVQCHRSWVVNLNYVEHIELNADIVQLVGGLKAGLGRVHRYNLMQRLRILS